MLRKTRLTVAAVSTAFVLVVAPALAALGPAAHGQQCEGPCPCGFIPESVPAPGPAVPAGSFNPSGGQGGDGGLNGCAQGHDQGFGQGQNAGGASGPTLGGGGEAPGVSPGVVPNLPPPSTLVLTRSTVNQRTGSNVNSKAKNGNRAGNANGGRGGNAGNRF